MDSVTKKLKRTANTLRHSYPRITLALSRSNCPQGDSEGTKHSKPSARVRSTTLLLLDPHVVKWREYLGVREMADKKSANVPRKEQWGDCCSMGLISPVHHVLNLKVGPSALNFCCLTEVFHATFHLIA